jgi:hypothetical protein
MSCIPICSLTVTKDTHYNKVWSNFGPDILIRFIGRRSLLLAPEQEWRDNVGALYQFASRAVLFVEISLGPAENGKYAL